MNTQSMVPIDEEMIAPDNNEESRFLDAIQDAEKRNQVISILKRAGLIL